MMMMAMPVAVARVWQRMQRRAGTAPATTTQPTHSKPVRPQGRQTQRDRPSHALPTCTHDLLVDFPVAVVVDVVSGDLRRAGMDRRLGVVAVALVRRVAVLVAVYVAGATLTHSKARYARQLGE